MGSIAGDRQTPVDQTFGKVAPARAEQGCLYYNQRIQNVAMPVSRHTREVNPIELFFDLVFVFGISQLSHPLLEHLSWRAAAESLVMLIAVLTVWSYTSWAATMVPPERPSARWMIL